MGSETKGASREIGLLVIRVGTLQEWFAFTDWARDKLMTSAAGLDDEQLDRPFEMGEGSLRKTLNHIFAAECVWLDRWERHPQPRYAASSEGVTMTHLWSEFRELSKRRDRFVASLADDQLGRDLTYTNRLGKTYTFPIGAMMLHVCVHGSHHRAQAMNMLRRVGAMLPKPGADYIFMKLEQPAGTPCVLDLDTLRTCFRYTDWAQGEVLASAASLSDEQLDRVFEMGEGTLRKTLGHIRDAEVWWNSNWTKGPGMLFPAGDDREPVRDIASSYKEVTARRDDFVRGLGDADLRRMVGAQPRPDRKLTLPIGVTMLQLCHHAIHHRAQAVNMLRHVGASIPAVDFLEMLKPG